MRGEGKPPSVVIAVIHLPRIFGRGARRLCTATYIKHFPTPKDQNHCHHPLSLLWVTNEYPEVLVP